MRENKFRGKVIGKQEELEAMGVIDKNGWATGNLIQNKQHTIVIQAKEIKKLTEINISLELENLNVKMQLNRE